MKVFDIDTTVFGSITCPYSQKVVDFYESGSDDLEGTFVKALLVEDVMDSTCFDAVDLTEAWEKFYEDNHEELSGRELVEKFEWEGLVALEVTTHGVACGPVSSTAYYVLEEKVANAIMEFTNTP